MAFQRPFLISLKRGDSSVRWGFGIKGGSDYGEPLLIQTVGEDSLAERCGLRAGDEVIQVGRVNVQDLTLGQVYELLARCGNKIEMFVIREDLLSPRKGKEPPVVKAIVHNPYNSPLSLYSTENVADALAKQTEVLVEGHVSTEEDEGPENLSFKQKSAVFQLLEEQAKQETAPKSASRGGSQSAVIVKPKTAPPPPPKPPTNPISNGYDYHPAHDYHQQQEHSRSSNRVEYQTTTSQRVVNQYQYPQQQPAQYQQTTVYQTRSPGYQSPGIDSQYSSSNQYYSQHPNQQTVSYQQTYQQNTYQQSQGYQSPVRSDNVHPGYQSPGVRSIHPGYQSPVSQNESVHPGYSSPGIRSENNYPGYQSPSTQSQKQLNQVTHQQTRSQQSRYQSHQQSEDTIHQLNQEPQFKPPAQQVQTTTSPVNRNTSQDNTQSKHQNRQQQSRHLQQSQIINQEAKVLHPPTVSKAEHKVGPPPPPRGKVVLPEDSMAAVYKQQYEKHLQQHQLQQQINYNEYDDEVPRAHIIEGEILQHNSSSGAPITYKAPPVAPPKPNWPPPPSSDFFKNTEPISPTEMDISSVWPPRKSAATDLPRTGFNPAAVREQGAGRRCVWPPQKHEDGGRTTPQSPSSGRRIQWNPSPSPPTHRRAVFGTAHSPARRTEIPWPPPGSDGMTNGRDHFSRSTPRMSRRAQFDDHVHQHASINVPQTYRPPPGTQHVEYR